MFNEVETVKVEMSGHRPRNVNVNLKYTPLFTKYNFITADLV